MFPPEYQGDLFFGDYAKGFIRNADLDSNGDITAVHNFDDQAGSVVDLKVAPDGSLYYITYFPGALYRITYNSTSHLPVASASADVTKGIEPLTVHFSSAGSRDPDGDPLNYEWSFGDGTTSTEANPTKTYSEKGVYIARLTVSAGGDEVPAQPIVIQAGLPPELNISTPAEGDLYRAGDTITYNAFAHDAAGFDLDDGDIKTEVRLHHGTHFHPFVGPLTGRAGSFTIPRTGEASADTSYEIKVTATDSNGLFTDKIVNVFPRKSQVSLATSPPGLGLTVDGVPVSTPRTFTGVEGFQRDLFAPSNAVAQDGTALQFGGWSDGKSIRHVISTPEDDTTYTATYRPSQPFTAKFYDNTTFSGTPAVTRQDPTINFAWGSGSPDPALPSDGFSVRWQKTQWFGAGRYEFTAVADDGVRLYIDGRRVIRQWQGPANTEFTHVVELGEGRHTIKMDYVERGGDALAALHWEGASDQPSDTYRAEYWNTPPGSYEIPATSPDIARDEDAIDHQWGAGSPDPAIAANRFLARWTRTISVEPGDYDFAVTADDGVRLYVDGVPVIDKWIDQPPTTYHATLPLDGGPHTVAMEYYENSGEATARLDYSRVGDPPADDTYHAQYWNTPDAVGPPSIPTGPADLEREEETLDFDWGGGSPGSPIAGDRFVARWTKTVVLSAGLYRFSGVRDDGIRAYIDNLPVVDKWTNGNEEYSVDKVVSGGPHELRVEYFEAFGGARRRVLLRANRRRRARRWRIHRGVLRQPQPGGHARRHAPGRRRRLRVGRRAARGRRPRRRLLGAVDEVAGGGRGGLVQVHRDRRRRRPTVRGRHEGAGQVDPAGPNHLHGHPPPLTGPARDRPRVLRGRRGRDRQARLRADLRSPTTAAGSVRGRVLRQQRPFRRSGPHPRRRCDRLRLGSGRTRLGRPIRPLLGALDTDQGLRGGHLSVQRHG